MSSTPEGVVPMPARPSFVREGDIATHLETMRTGQRLTMDFAYDLLPRIGAAAIEHAAAELGRHFIYAHTHEIERAVSTVLADTDWFRAQVGKAINRYVHAEIEAMFSLAQREAPHE